MSEKSLALEDDFKREEMKRELKRNIVIGSILRTIHKQQGAMPYLLTVVEPFLKKSDRKLFGLPF